MLVSVELVTNQAYNGAGGKSLYDPSWAFVVSFDRPGGLPDGRELPLHGWLAPRGWDVDTKIMRPEGRRPNNPRPSGEASVAGLGDLQRFGPLSGTSRELTTRRPQHSTHPSLRDTRCFRSSCSARPAAALLRPACRLTRRGTAARDSRLADCASGGFARCRLFGKQHCACAARPFASTCHAISPWPTLP